MSGKIGIMTDGTPEALAVAVELGYEPVRSWHHAFTNVALVKMHGTVVPMVRSEKTLEDIVSARAVGKLKHDERIRRLKMIGAHGGVHIDEIRERARSFARNCGLVTNPDPGKMLHGPFYLEAVTSEVFAAAEIARQVSSKLPSEFSVRPFNDRCAVVGFCMGDGTIAGIGHFVCPGERA